MIGERLLPIFHFMIRVVYGNRGFTRRLLLKTLWRLLQMVSSVFCLHWLRVQGKQLLLFRLPGNCFKQDGLYSVMESDAQGFYFLPTGTFLLIRLIMLFRLFRMMQ